MDGTAVGPATGALVGSMMIINAVTTLNICSFTVDKNKPKTSSCQQPPQDQSSQPSQNNGPAVGVPPSVAEDGKKDQQFRGLLAASNCRFEAVAIVLQQILAEV